MVAYHVHILRTPKSDMSDCLGYAQASAPKRCFRVAHPSGWVEEGEGVVTT